MRIDKSYINHEGHEAHEEGKRLFSFVHVGTSWLIQMNDA